MGAGDNARRQHAVSLCHWPTLASQPLARCLSPPHRSRPRLFRPTELTTDRGKTLRLVFPLCNGDYISGVGDHSLAANTTTTMRLDGTEAKRTRGWTPQSSPNPSHQPEVNTYHTASEVNK